MYEDPVAEEETRHIQTDNQMTEEREIGIKTTERNPMLMDNDTPG